VVAVVTPDAAHAGGACRAGTAQCVDELVEERAAAVAGLLSGVDHQLLPDAESRGVGAGDAAGLGELDAIAFADADALERNERLRELCAELGEHGGDAVAVTDRDDHQRDTLVAADEACALAGAVGGAVDAEQHGGTGDAALVQQVDDRLYAGRPSIRSWRPT
jgi:hypothetical protein